MIKKRYLLALTGLLASFASFNMASYAGGFKCANGDQELDYRYVSRTGFSPDSNTFYIVTQNDSKTFFNKLDTKNKEYKNAYVQPLEIAAFLSHIPVHFCYNVTDGKNWIEKLELEEN